MHYKTITECVETKQHRNRIERHFQRTRSSSDRRSVWPASQCHLLHETRANYMRCQMDDTHGGICCQWNMVYDLLHPSHHDHIRSNSVDDARLANGFSAFFIDKLCSIQAKIAASLSASPTGILVVQYPVPLSPSFLHEFIYKMRSQVTHLIRLAPNKTSS